jgi:hypothetical protein
MHINLWTVFHSKLFYGRWEKGEEDKKFDFYKVRILDSKLILQPRMRTVFFPVFPIYTLVA